MGRRYLYAASEVCSGGRARPLCGHKRCVVRPPAPKKQILYGLAGRQSFTELKNQRLD